MLHSIRVVLLLACVASFAFGCARQQLFCDIPEYYLAMPADQIEEEISLLEKKIAPELTDSRDELLPEAYYYLALLYSHYNNPSPDYGKALKSLNRYASDLPPEIEAHDVFYLENLLEKLEGLVRLKKGYIQLQGEHIELEKDYGRLRRQLDNLVQEHSSLIQKHRTTKETIEKLKMLDIKLEQKKREIE